MHVEDFSNTQDECNTFLDIYTKLLCAYEITIRGESVKELTNVMFSLRPYDMFTSFKARNFNLQYAKKEFIWYLSGNPYSRMIEDEAQIWKDLRQPSGRYFSNYGQYVFGEQNGIDFVSKELINDKFSRRAVIPMIRAEHMFDGNKDVVCTHALSFNIRNDMLNMTVHMRSNDAIWGMTNDIITFRLIQECLLVMLQDYWNDLKMGYYTHIVDSLHVYSRHYKMLKNIVSEGTAGYEKIRKPKMHSVLEFHDIKNAAMNDTVEDLFENSTYAFTHWLFG